MGKRKAEINVLLTRWKLILGLFAVIVSGVVSTIVFVDTRYAHAATVTKDLSTIRTQAKSSFIDLRLAMAQHQLYDLVLQHPSGKLPPRALRYKKSLEDAIDNLYKIRQVLEEKAIQEL